MLRAACAALLATALALPAAASGWGDLYAFPDRPARSARPAPATGAMSAPEATAPARSICIREILRAQLRHGIPGNLLLGIGLQEAGSTRGGTLTVWPWAVNAAGEGRSFADRDAAMAWVRERRAAGVQSIDVGCMQVNLRWHPDAFATLEEGFDPRINVDYAARFLKRLHDKTGDWALAAGSYHSFSPDKRDIYLASLGRNTEVANARIDSFRALAGAAPGSASAAAPPPEAEMTTSPAPRRRRAPDDRAIWSAGLTAGVPARSIYSAEDLQPILPAFRQMPGLGE